MKRAFASILLLVLCFHLNASSSGRQTPATARLIDSFDDRILVTDIKARLDNFAIELQNAPDAKGYLVFYAARNRFPGWVGRRALARMGRLEDMLGLGPRVSLINGGLADETKFELWFVPAGAPAPSVKPFDLSTLMSGERGPLPFDRFDVVERGESPIADEGVFYPDAKGLYDYLAEVLRADPGLRACVIAYASRRAARSTDRRIAARAKRAIVESQAVDVRRVVALGGGRRRYKAVEVWLVPPGAPMPKASPDARVSRRRRR